LQGILLALFYYKNKKTVEEKLTEWENILAGDKDVQSQKLLRHLQ
jgi:hypothetical protein